MLAISVMPVLAAPTQPTSPATTPRPTTSVNTSGNNSMAAAAGTANRSNTASTTNRTGAQPAASNSATNAPKPVPSVAIKGILVAADVGSDKIKMEDLNRLIDGIVQQYPKLAENTPEAQKALKELREERLNNMIAQQLLYQEAMRRNLQPTKIQIDREVVRFYDAMRFQNDGEFQKWLAEEGKTEADLRATISKRLAGELLKEEIVKTVKVEDADLRQFYNENKSTLFTIPQSVVARHIQINFPPNPKRDEKFRPLPPTEQDKAKAKTKAQGVLKKATASNADFAALAKEHSEDTMSKNRGGVVDVPELDNQMRITGFRLISTDDKKNVDPKFFEALFNAPVGKVYSQLVETAYGYHIVKVEERKPSKTLSFEEAVKAPMGTTAGGQPITMKAVVLEQKSQKAINAKVQELKNATRIAIHLPGQS